jgi:hypothetical protein
VPVLTSTPAASASAAANQEISAPVIQRSTPGSRSAPIAARTSTWAINKPITSMSVSCRGVALDQCMSSKLAAYDPRTLKSSNTTTLPNNPATNTATHVGKNPGRLSDRRGSIPRRSAAGAER